jgi:threonine dehydratase
MSDDEENLEVEETEREEAEEQPRGEPSMAASPGAGSVVPGAADGLRGEIFESPLAWPASLTRPGGPRIGLKLENLQMTGSFKERGALWKLLYLTPRERRRGVVTASAGNHAQAVAYHARRLGIRCTVVMPEATPLIKVTSARRYGAEVILAGANFDEAYDHAREVAAARGLAFVHPFDDDRFIAGNGTVALEIFEDLPDADAIVAPLGGGGLLAGIAAAAAALRPRTQIFAAEPETASPLAASLAAGRPIFLDGWKASFVDGAGGQSVLESMWPLLRPLAGSIVVSLDEAARAMRLVAERARVIAEGAAGCAVAAALSGRAGRGKIVAVVSGGNIDLARFAELTL